MTQATIAFIGCGNMAASILQGLLADHYPKEKLWTTNRSNEKINNFKSQGLRATKDNSEAINQADVIVLGVKPQQMRELCLSIKGSVQENKPLIISLAVGVSTQMLSAWLGDDLAIVRSMPNTPSMVGAGASGLYANAAVSAQQKNIAESLHRAVGIAIWVDSEKHIDVVASLSGSGPAYFYYMIEALQDAAVDLGLHRKDANALALQTAFGAAKLAMESSENVGQLRQKVTSPKGTTEQAINTFNSEGMRAIFKKGMANAVKRADELSRALME